MIFPAAPWHLDRAGLEPEGTKIPGSQADTPARGRAPGLRGELCLPVAGAQTASMPHRGTGAVAKSEPWTAEGARTLSTLAGTDGAGASPGPCSLPGRAPLAPAAHLCLLDLQQAPLGLPSLCALRPRAHRARGAFGAAGMPCPCPAGRRSVPCRQGNGRREGRGRGGRHPGSARDPALQVETEPGRPAVLTQLRAAEGDRKYTAKDK